MHVKFLLLPILTSSESIQKSVGIALASIVSLNNIVLLGIIDGNRHGLEEGLSDGIDNGTLDVGGTADISTDGLIDGKEDAFIDGLFDGMVHV